MRLDVEERLIDQVGVPRGQRAGEGALGLVEVEEEGHLFVFFFLILFISKGEKKERRVYVVNLGGCFVLVLKGWCSVLFWGGWCYGLFGWMWWWVVIPPPPFTP